MICPPTSCAMCSRHSMTSSAATVRSCPIAAVISVDWMRSSCAKCCARCKGRDRMRKHIVFCLAVMLAPSLGAQQRDTAAGAATAARNDTAEARALRDRIEAAFSERVQENLNLSTEQSTKLRATQERFGARRRTLQQQQMDRRRAIDDQMQPGVAANQDSLRMLLDAQRTGRAELAKIEQDEDQEMAGYLTPVQRARYEQMRGRLMQRVVEMQLERRDGRMGRGMQPGVRPGQRAGRRGRGI